MSLPLNDAGDPNAEEIQQVRAAIDHVVAKNDEYLASLEKQIKANSGWSFYIGRKARELLPSVGVGALAVITQVVTGPQGWTLIALEFGAASLLIHGIRNAPSTQAVKNWVKN